MSIVRSHLVYFPEFDNWFDGFDWNNPNPRIAKYYRAIQWAILERLVDLDMSVPDMLNKSIYGSEGSRNKIHLDYDYVVALHNAIESLIPKFVNSNINNGNFSGLDEIPLWTKVDIYKHVLKPKGFDGWVVPYKNVYSNELWLKQSYHVLCVLYLLKVSLNTYRQSGFRRAKWSAMQADRYRNEVSETQFRYIDPKDSEGNPTWRKSQIVAYDPHWKSGVWPQPAKYATWKWDHVMDGLKGALLVDGYSNRLSYEAEKCSRRTVDRYGGVFWEPGFEDKTEIKETAIIFNLDGFRSPYTGYGEIFIKYVHDEEATFRMRADGYNFMSGIGAIERNDEPYFYLEEHCPEIIEPEDPLDIDMEFVREQRRIQEVCDESDRNTTSGKSGLYTDFIMLIHKNRENGYAFVAPGI